MSALSIPEHGRELENAVRGVWDVLSGATDETLPAFRTIPKVKAAVGAFDDASVLAVVEALLSRSPAPTAVTSGYLAHEAPSVDGWERAARVELEGWAADALVAL